MKLNLEASNKAEERILEYLEENASDSLAEKINNGVRIVKDDKALISRKDLGGFMKYATEEARKASKSGATSAYIDDDVVFSWAIHYFEEDSIEGKLYNEDGTEYAPPKASKPVSKTTTATRNTSKATTSTVTQKSLFDLMASDEKENEELPTPQTVIDEQEDEQENMRENEQEEVLNAVKEKKECIPRLP